MMSPTPIAGWGRQFVDAEELHPESLEDAPPVLFRGLGRSYGDSSLPPASNPVVVNTTRANRIIHFDSATGVLRAEAGLTLADLNRTFLPRGWFPPVTPGTSQVTLGGMVAADVHGKNHHVEGCIGQHVRRLKMRVADGRVLECGPDLERELFLATVAGMGLTGQILEVEFGLRRIPTPWIWQESERVANIEEYIEVLGADVGRVERRKVGLTVPAERSRGSVRPLVSGSTVSSTSLGQNGYGLKAGETGVTVPVLVRRALIRGASRYRTLPLAESSTSRRSVAHTSASPLLFTTALTSCASSPAASALPLLESETSSDFTLPPRKSRSPAP
ncbi:MAG TPA: FAD-binding oxidoreductase, partial [Archangium sp.]